MCVVSLTLLITMNDLRKHIQQLKSEKDLLDLINRMMKEDMGEFYYPLTLQQLAFYANTSDVPTKKRYRIFSIPKKNGQNREISSPVRQLKYIQYYVKQILESLYEPKDCVMGFVKKKSVVDNAKKHLLKYYVLNLDIMNFFPSITQDMILKMLVHVPYHIDYGVAFLMARLCCIKKDDGNKVLPQGSPTSPILANMVCSELDKKIMALSFKFNVEYTRYADDMTFSCQYNSFKDEDCFMKELNSIIKESGFELNQEKKRIQKYGARQEVTGIIVSAKTNVRRKYIKNLRVMLHNWEKAGYEDASRRFVEVYNKDGKKRNSVIPELKNVLDGKLEYLKMVKGQGDMTYLRLKDRFDRLLFKLEAKLIKSWNWNDFEEENNIKLHISCFPSSKTYYVDIPSNGKSYRFIFSNYEGKPNENNLQINLMQSENKNFYNVSEVKVDDSLLELLNI